MDRTSTVGYCSAGASGTRTHARSTSVHPKTSALMTDEAREQKKLVVLCYFYAGDYGEATSTQQCKISDNSVDDLPSRCSQEDCNCQICTAAGKDCGNCGSNDGYSDNRRPNQLDDARQRCRQEGCDCDYCTAAGEDCGNCGGYDDGY